MQRQGCNVRKTLVAGIGFTAINLALSSAAIGGGLYIQEYASPSMGTADAGSQAWANNASTAWHNPAGMTQLDRSEIQLGVGLAGSEVKFDPDNGTPTGGNDGGDAGSFAPLGQFNGVIKLDDGWAAGLNIGGITGAALDYDNGWAGRYQVFDTSLAIFGVHPSLAFQVTDWLSVGGGPIISYATLDYKVAAPPPAGTGRIKIDDADDTEISGRFGALARFGESTRIGVVFQTESKYELEGNTTVDPLGLAFNATLEILLPRYLQIGGFHEINDQWAILGSVRWEDWDSFEDLPVSVEAGNTALPRNWRDTYGVTLGVHYKPTEQMMLQAGIGYDTSPVSDANRTADMPVDRQIRIATGLQYQLSERATIGGSLVYLDLGDSKIDGDTVKGSYDDNRALVAGLNFGWKF